MATLSSAIVKQQVASMHDVEEALARQVLYGGDLATNLLETAMISEASLTAVIAKCHGFVPAPPGPLPQPNPGTLRLVPGDLAVRHGIYPIGERPGELWIAVAEPIPAEVENDLAFALGVNVVQHGALLVRVREAIARDYGAPLERRLARLLDRLARGGSASMPPSEPPAERRTASGTLRLPRPDTLPPRAYPPEGLLPMSRRPTLDPSLLRTGAVSGAATGSSQSLDPAPAVDRAPADESRAVSEAGEAAAGAEQRESESIAPPRGSEPPPIPLIRQSRSPAARPTEEPSRASSGGAASAGDRHATEPSLQAPRLAGVTSAPGAATPSVAPGSMRPRHRRGPYTAAAAERDLQAATTRDEVIRACFDFCAQFFEYAALFTVQGELAEGRESAGAGAEREAVSQLAIPLDRPGVLAAAKARGSWVLAPLTTEGTDPFLAHELRRPTGVPVLVLPVVIRDRTVLLLWGDHGEDGVDLDAVGEVIPFVALTAAALERVILQRKRAARRAVAVQDLLEGMPQPLVQPAAAPLPPVETRAQVLAGALTPKAPRRFEVPALAEPLAPSPPPVTTLDAQTDLQDALTPAVPPAVRASWTEPVTSAPVQPTTPHAAVSVSQRTPAAGVIVGEAARHPTRRGVAPPAGGVIPPEYSVRPATADLDAGWETGDAIAARTAADSLLPPADRDDRRAPGAERAPATTEAGDADTDASSLIERLAHGDASAIDALVDFGESVIPALVARLPGPITSEPRLTAREATPASRCGPVLDAITRFGAPAVPYLQVRAADADAQVRAWTVRLLGELGSPDAARTIARRAEDDDEQVRQAVIAAARLLERDPPALARLREQLLVTARDPQATAPSRLAAIETLGRTRDATAVPGLIALLDDERPDIRKSVVWALVAITCQDFGSNIGAWRDWWLAHGDGHRIEWLIDALTHDNEEIRHVAGEELKHTTREYFGYYDDLPRHERARAQDRYREWWVARGRAAFGGRPS